MLADELFEAAQNIRPYVDHPDSLYADAYDPVTQAKGLHVLRLLDELRGELDRPPTAEQAAMAARYRHTQERVEAAAAAARKSPAPLVRRGMRTPWGVATSATVLAPGVGYVVTPGHGGYKLDRRLNASVPPYMRQPGGWYEYDCDWAIAYCACEDAFRASASFTVARLLEDARETLRRWRPAEYACFYGVPPTAALDGSDAFDPRVVWTDAQVRFSVIRDSTRTSEYEVLDRNTGKMVELVGIRGDRLHACDEVAEWVIDFKVAADVESGKLGAALDEAESQAFGPGYRRLTDGVVILARRR